MNNKNSETCQYNSIETFSACPSGCLDYGWAPCNANIYNTVYQGGTTCCCPK